MQENNPHKRPSEPIPAPAAEPEPTPFEKGQAAAAKFSLTKPENPWADGTDEGKEWAEGYATQCHTIAQRARAWFLLGASTPHGYNFAPPAYGGLVTSMMQVNGQAMACVFVGAMLTHRGHEPPTLQEARPCFEAATYGSTGRPLYEHLQDCETARLVHEIATEMRDFVKAEDEQAFAAGKATKISVDATALMQRLVHGYPPKEPPEEEGGGE